MRKSVLLAGLTVLAACNTPFNPNFPPGSLAGAWSGTLTSAGANVGTLELSLVALTSYPAPARGGPGGWTMGGSWSAALGANAANGTVSAAGVDGALDLQFNLQGAGGCAIVLNGEQRGASTMAGHYTAASCPLPDTGSFSVSKQ